MKISYNWLKDYLDIDIEPVELGEILTNLGLEVEGITTFESIPGGLEGILVGEVLTCQKHPNADKLSVTTVNLGDSQTVQIVCGAPNVAAGQKVLVATVGSFLYQSDGEPWKIKKTKIRGEVSEGMICAEDELGLGTDHTGIMVLDPKFEVGNAASHHFPVETDIIFEIGLTPNRSDATCHLGVAKDILAYLKVNEDYAGRIILPDSARLNVESKSFPIEVEVQDHSACPRYSGITITDLEIKPSPTWMQNRLKAIGVRPINNIVDISNYVLHELGQPTHAFDYDRISGQKIIVKCLAEGSTFVSLDEEERTLTGDDLMICDGDENGMCIGGVFGGLKSGVSAQTKTIFLESAHFSAKSIRKSSMHHLLRTDAAMIFEKGSDPNLPVVALKRAVSLIQELAGGKVSSRLIDIYPNKIEPQQINLHYDKINQLIGVKLSKNEIGNILRALEMSINNMHSEGLNVSVPTNKADVTREVDVIEEILRIYGFNKVPLDEMVNYTFTYTQHPEPSFLRNKIGDYLAALGFAEAMSMSLTQSKYYTASQKHIVDGDLVLINNTSNVHLDAMRGNMIFSVLENFQYNFNRQVSRVQLYEFGKIYSTVDEQFVEKEQLTLALGGVRHADHWLDGKSESLTFYDLKKYVEQTLQLLGVWPIELKELKPDNTTFQYGLEGLLGQDQVVSLGEVIKKLCRQFGIKQPVYYAEFNWDLLASRAGKETVTSKEFSKFPSTRRDLALVIDQAISYHQIEQVVLSTETKLIKKMGLFDVFEDTEVLGKNKKSYAVYLVFAHHEKTLNDKEVDKSVKKILKALEDQIGAILR